MKYAIATRAKRRGRRTAKSQIDATHSLAACYRDSEHVGIEGDYCNGTEISQCVNPGVLAMTG